MLSGATVEFYAELRWAGWEAEAEALALDQGLSVYPPPFTVEGQDLHAATRAPVPHSELVGFLDEAALQIP
jgi:hypothetical protein